MEIFFHEGDKNKNDDEVLPMCSLSGDSRLAPWVQFCVGAEHQKRRIRRLCEFTVWAVMHNEGDLKQVNRSCWKDTTQRMSLLNA